MNKILVIEDTKSVLDEIKMILSLENYQVLEALDGEQGIEVAKKHIPDLIICDVMMPMVNGYDVLETLRQDKSTLSIPFIFLTAKAGKQDFRKGMLLGADDYITKPFTSEEIVEAVKARLDKYDKEKKLNQEKIDLLNTELEKERLVSQIDHLTGAANRRGFFKKAEIEISRAKRRKYPITLVYFDLDNFKNVNDFFGHEAGDIVLKSVSECIINNIRVTDIFARFGGDEFVIMLPEADNQASQKIITRINDLFLEKMAENKWPVTLSIGIITFNNLNLPISDMISFTDNFMYKAKMQGKNKIFYDTVN